MLYKSVKTALLLSNVIDADHQNSCLFTNKGYFSLPLSGWDDDLKMNTYQYHVSYFEFASHMRQD